jgi:hypothetical protein
MVPIRKVTLWLLLSAALSVLILAVFLLWNYLQRGSVEILAKRLGDVELLVLILLGTSGLYAIVFVASSYFSAVTFARQADRSIADIKEQLGVALADLRAQREAPGNFEAQVAVIAERMAGWDTASLDEQRKLELLHYESAAAYLELAGGPQVAAPMAGLYRGFAGCYSSSDPARARFYLSRALLLAPPGSPLAAWVHYDLACCLAVERDFEHAARELSVAFQNQSKALDERLVHDIEEGGELYELASTPPFDKVVNDVLLSVVL